MPLTSGAAERGETGLPEKIHFTYASAEYRKHTRLFIQALELMTGQPKLKKLYYKYVHEQAATRDFYDAAVDLLGLQVDYSTGDLTRIPREGPLVFVANHPYGVLDGIVFTWLTRKARPEVQVMANSILCQSPEASAHLLPVDFSGTREALRTNVESRTEAQKIVMNGGAVGLFPGGGVAASEKPLKGPALDLAWSPFLAKLVQRSKATVVPIYFAGQNSRLFQIASHYSLPVRLALIFHETVRRMGDRVQVAIGDPIYFNELPGRDNRAELIAGLRRSTYELAHKLNLPEGQIPVPDRPFVFPERVNA